jgi:hypothetical protein
MANLELLLECLTSLFSYCNKAVCRCPGGKSLEMQPFHASKGRGFSASFQGPKSCNARSTVKKILSLGSEIYTTVLKPVMYLLS